MAPGRAAIILAAGASQRMGTPKALLPWADSTLLDYAVQQARLADVADLVVVVGPATRDITVNATTVYNPDPETGRSASIRLATEAISVVPDAIVIQSVDQPVAAEILNALFTAIDAHIDIAIPTFAGRRGHPVCVTGRLLAELRDVTEAEQGLRAVVRRHAERVREVLVESDAVVWNLNDPAAYAAARALK